MLLERSIVVLFSAGVHCSSTWSKPPEYAYLSRLTELEDRKRDLDYLVERAPYFSVGTPAFFIERWRGCSRLDVTLTKRELFEVLVML